MWRKCLRLKVQIGAFRLRAVAAISVNQADALRQMQEAEVADGLQAFKVCGPDERKMFCELIYG